MEDSLSLAKTATDVFAFLLFISGILTAGVGIKSIKEKRSIPPLGRSTGYVTGRNESTGREAILSGIVYLIISLFFFYFAFYFVCQVHNVRVF